VIFLRKLARDLRAQLGQTLAVVVVIALGSMLFVAAAGAYEDLSASYANTQTTLAQADLQVQVTRASAADVEHVRALSGVATADARTVVTLPVRVRDGAVEDRVAMRVISVPDAGQPALDQLVLISGHLPHGPDELLLEKHFAQHHGLGPGGMLRLDAGGVSRELRVSGVGVSAEYLWVARDATDLFPSPDEFGVGWMQRSALRDVARAVMAANPDAAQLEPALVVAAGPNANEVLLARSPDTSADGLLGIARRAFGDAVLVATPRERLVGIRLLQMDVDGYRGMAGFFPVFFLGVGAFIVAALLARLVDAERPVLGTLMALGMSRTSVLLQVLAHAIVLCAAGSVAGAAAGLALAPILTRAYAADLGIPFVTSRMHGGLAAIAIVIGFVVAIAAGLFPAMHASSIAPAEAMRPPRPSAGVLARLARHLPAPMPVRLALRDLLGRPLRSASTALGISAALVLVLATGSMLDSMRTTFAVLFHDARRYDLRVDLAAPEPAADARARFQAIGGVTETEALVVLPATVSAAGRSTEVLLQGLPAGSQLAHSVDMDGREVVPRVGTVVLTRALAAKLGVAAGDAVQVHGPSGTTASLRVEGMADGAMGPTASARLADVQRALGLGDRVTSVAILTRGDVRHTRAALATMGDVAHVEDVNALRDQVGALMGLGWALLGAMLLFGGVLAAAILFNTATLAILERWCELATLRALGRTQREIFASMTLENALLAIAGLTLGYPLATAGSRAILKLYSSDLFRLPYVMAPPTIALTICGILAVLLIAQWPALRRLARASLAEAVRTRE
jgi:putative ABC transport system permease protein